MSPALFLLITGHRSRITDHTCNISVTTPPGFYDIL
jgi:hypothetical protein